MRHKAQLAFAFLGLAALSSNAASAQLASEGGKRYTIELTGEAEIPPGDPDGTGTAIITVNRGQQRVCLHFTVSGVAPIAAAHIHIGLRGQAFSGNIVVPFTITTPTLTISSTCTSVTNTELLSALIQAPQAFYVNLHNAPFPGGALRGQLND